MAGGPSPQTPVSTMRLGQIGKPILRLVMCMVAVLTVTAVLYAVPLHYRGSAASFTFLILILVISAFFGFRYGICVSVLTALGFSWLLPPIGYFWLSDWRDVFTLAAFLIIGTTAGHFSDRARREALNANQRRAETVAAQEELRRSEGYLAEAQRLTRTGSWAYSPLTGKTIFWSDEMFRIFGLDPQEGPSSEKFWQLVHQEDRDRVGARVEKEAREKTEYVDEYRIVLLDGTVKHILDIGHPVFNDAGDLLEFVGTSVDVTERKRAEETLRRSEAYLAEAQRLTQTGSFALDPNTLEPVYLSDEVIRMWGYDPEDGLPTRGQLLDRFHPADRDKAIEVTNKCRLNKTDVEDEFRIVLPGGRLKYIHRIIHAVLNATGEVVELIGTNVDVTERKRAEEEVRAAETRFRTYVDHATDVLFVHDEQGKILDMNRQASESLGYTREELIGAMPSLFDPDANAIAIQQIRERLEAGELVAFESTNRRKDGTTFPVEVRVSPFQHSGHRFSLSVARDISERRRAEEERKRLRQMERDLAHVNRVSMMGELAASLSHEIKQPITAAAMNAKTSLRWLQREHPEIGEACETISRVVKDVTRATEIIDRNSSLYKRETPIRATVNLNQLIREMVVLLYDAANRHSVSIRSELCSALPAITADRVQIQQVLMNLMLNGIEAMKDTGGELVIQSNGAEDGQIVVSVSDSGVGLPVDDPNLIFDAFFTTKAQGTGMGLSISRRIIDSHGGRLWASGNPERGATFSFVLPVVPKPNGMSSEGA